jgi:hypothetical protein
MPTKNELLAEAAELDLDIPKSLSKAEVEKRLTGFKENAGRDAAEAKARADEAKKRVEEELIADAARNRRPSVDDVPVDGCSICKTPAVWASDGRVASKVFYCKSHYNKYGEG